MAITVETHDDVLDVAWPHYRLTAETAQVAPSEIEGEIVSLRVRDFSVDFVIGDDRRVIASRGPLAEHPDVFTAVPREPAEDGRPRKPYYVLAEGVELPD